MRVVPTDDGALAVSPEAAAEVREEVTAFVDGVVDDTDSRRAVVPLDGGVASAVVVALAVDALGTDRVDALVMPAHLNSEAAARDAETLASAAGIDAHRIQLQPLLAAFREAMGAAGAPADDLLAVENVLERFRMACAYYVANTGDRIVLGSATRTERLLGSITKHGDVGVDALPLGHRYHTEVCALADALGVPDTVTERPWGFGSGPTDAEQLGVDDRTLDEVLAAVEADLAVDDIAERTGVDPETVARVRSWRDRTEHKRRPPVTPDRTADLR